MLSLGSYSLRNRAILEGFSLHFSTASSVILFVIWKLIEMSPEVKLERKGGVGEYVLIVLNDMGNRIIKRWGIGFNNNYYPSRIYFLD